jgi:hypothetical protein
MISEYLGFHDKQIEKLVLVKNLEDYSIKGIPAEPEVYFNTEEELEYFILNYFLTNSASVDALVDDGLKFELMRQCNSIARETLRAMGRTILLNEEAHEAYNQISEIPSFKYIFNEDVPVNRIIVLYSSPSWKFDRPAHYIKTEDGKFGLHYSGSEKYARVLNLSRFKPSIIYYDPVRKYYEIC